MHTLRSVRAPPAASPTASSRTAARSFPPPASRIARSDHPVVRPVLEASPVGLVCPENPAVLLPATSRAGGASGGFLVVIALPFLPCKLCLFRWELGDSWCAVVGKTGKTTTSSRTACSGHFGVGEDE